MRMTGWFTAEPGKKRRPSWQLQARLAECRLEMHPTKTKIVYCKDGKRKGKYPNVKFDFSVRLSTPLGAKLRDWLNCSGGFNPAVSPSALKAMRRRSGTWASVVKRSCPCRHRPQAQSSPPRMDCVLWALCPLGTYPTAAIRQSDATRLGDA